MSDIVDSIVMLTGAEYVKMTAEIAASNHFAVKYLAHIDEQNVEIARLTAENAKLRAALERIADTDPDEGTQWFHEVATAALSGDKHE